MVAAAGFAAGAAIVAHSPLWAIDDWLSEIGPRLEPSVAGFLGVRSWIVIVAGLALIATVLLRFPSSSPSDRRWPWAITGTGLGLLGVLAWLTGAPSGWHWGLSMTGPSRSLVEALFFANPGYLNWGSLMLVGVPLGTWASARSMGPIAWRTAPLPELARRFLGGGLMGIGGTLAAGCNIGNALTGLSVLALNSVIATLGILAGGALAIRTQGAIAAIAGSVVAKGRG